MKRKDLARKIVEVSYREGDFILSSGRKSKYYLDKYLFTSKPELLQAIAREMSRTIPKNTDKLAGTELGAVPLITALSLKTGIPFVIIRKKHKEYGTKKDMEGELNPGERVVLVEDVLTTGRQAISSADLLKTKGAKVLKIMAVVDRQEGARANIEKAGYYLESLFTREELGVL